MADPVSNTTEFEHARTLSPGSRLNTVDVYLIAKIEFQPNMAGWPLVGPKPEYKIGYSNDPFRRVDELKSCSPYNLALFGVILCGDEATASKTEDRCHKLLDHWSGRGEWFKHNAWESWEILAAEFPHASKLLTRWYTIDIDAMRLVPPAAGTWNGHADWWHWYRAFKSTGIVPPWPKSAEEEDRACAARRPKRKAG